MGQTALIGVVLIFHSMYVMCSPTSISILMPQLHLAERPILWFAPIVMGRVMTIIIVDL